MAKKGLNYIVRFAFELTVIEQDISTKNYWSRCDGVKESILDLIVVTKRSLERTPNISNSLKN